MASDNSELSRADVLLSVQRALLGTISVQILAVCVDWVGKNIEMTVFAEGSLPDNQREAVEIAGTEIGADFTLPVSVEVTIVEKAKQPLRGSGGWVFVRFGCLVR
jgi:hypothetical protein